MPDRIPRVAYPGPTVRPKEELSPEARERKRFLDSAAWRRLRRIKLGKNPLCQDCEDEGRISPAIDVHHIKSRRERPELAMVLTNLRSLCRPHHTRRTNRGE